MHFKFNHKLPFFDDEESKKCFDLISSNLNQHLTDGKRIEIRGFGSFSIRERKYPDQDKYYKSVYYRPSSKIIQKINK